MMLSEATMVISKGRATNLGCGGVCVELSSLSPVFLLCLISSNVYFLSAFLLSLSDPMFVSSISS
jgi:hypothetical protein